MAERERISDGQVRSFERGHVSRAQAPGRHLDQHLTVLWWRFGCLGNHDVAWAGHHHLPQRNSSGLSVEPHDATESAVDKEGLAGDVPAEIRRSEERRVGKGWRNQERLK